jgi:hypothetical protein
MLSYAEHVHSLEGTVTVELIRLLRIAQEVEKVENPDAIEYNYCA